MNASPLPLNLHHHSEIDDLAARIAFEDPSETIVLSGETASGRRYLMRAAAADARGRGVDVWLSAIDLDGYEPEAETLEAYVRFQLDKGARGVGEGSVERIASVPGPDPLERALAAALILGRDEASGALVEPLLAGGLPSLFPPDAGDRRVVVQVADVSEISVVLRERLFAWADSEPRLRLALSCLPSEGRAIVGPGREMARFELQPLEPGDIQGLVDLQGGRVLDPGEAERIAEVSGGLAGAAARALDVDEPWADPLEPLAEAPEAQRDRLRTLLHLGALCGDNVPVRALAEFLGVEGDEQEDFIDLLDETVGSDADRPLFADRFQHPSFPGEQIYGFADPLVPALLLRRIPADSRQRLAAELSAFLLRVAPPTTRAGAGLHLELSIHAEATAYRREFRRELACWIGPAETKELTAILESEVRSEFRGAPDIWSTVNNVQFRWPAWRTLAAIDAVRPEWIHPQLVGPRAAVRAGLLLDLGRFDEALAEAAKGREGCEDPLIEAALFDRTGVALRRLGREPEAVAAHQRSLRICETLFEQGDRRVIPWMRERAASLRRAGKNEEAAVLELKLAAARDA